MKKKFLIGVLVFLVVVLPVYGFAQSFSTSDLEGSWIGYDISVIPSIPAVFWLRGNVTIDSSGNFTSASYTAPDGSTVSMTSGSAALDANGVMSGSFTVDTGDTVTVNHGKLDSGKTHAAYVNTATDGSMGIGLFFKSGGTTFSSQDLEGSWHAYTTIIDPSMGAVFWAYGTFSVDSQGSMTGSFTAADGMDTAITSGTLTTDTSGILSGQFALDIPQTVPIVHGKLDQSKTIGAFVSVDPTTGIMAYAWIVKAVGTFADQDLEDIWYSYSISVDPTAPAVFWLRGKYSLNASGNLVGSYVAPTGDRIRATSGSMSIDGSGVITGGFNLDTSDTATLPNGKLDQGKTSGFGVFATSAGMLSMAMVFKVDTIQPSFAGAATNAVLANMYNATAVAYAGYAVGGAPQNYPLMQLYAQSAYEFAEDAHFQAFAALDQSSTFWGIYAEQYAASDLDNRSQSLNYYNLAVQSATGGDLQTAAYYAGFGLALGGTADLYNGTTIWCSSMEQGASP